jgi:DNA-binding XRE family transcriptional regulator
VDREPLAARLKARREELELSQTDLGALIGVNQRTVSAWEKGKSRPLKREVVGKLAAALRWDKDDLWALIGEDAERDAAEKGEAAAEAQARESRTVAIVERFVSKYQELGHTYIAIGEMTQQSLGIQVSVQETVIEMQGTLADLLTRVDRLERKR